MDFTSVHTRAEHVLVSRVVGYVDCVWSAAVVNPNPNQTQSTAAHTRRRARAHACMHTIALAHVCSLLLPCLAYAFSVASRLFPAWCFVLVFSWTWTRVFAYVLLVYTCCCHALLSTKSL